MILNLIKAIRPINLFVIAFTFYVLYLLNINSKEYIPKSFYYTFISIKLLCISTILIAAAGYLINDYYDKEIDLINKPLKKVVLNDKTLITTYITLNCIALLLSYLFANSQALFWIFPCSIFLLWIYSYKLKKLPFIGNLAIAILSAIVPFIFLIITQPYYTDCQNPISEVVATELTIIFSILAFFSTLAREAVKDTEDIEGDKALQLKTIPIIWGVKTAKVFSISFTFTTLVILGLLIKNHTWFNFSSLALVVGAITSIPLLLAIVKTYSGNEKKHFKQAGNLIKMAMFGFLIFIYIHAITL